MQKTKRSRMIAVVAMLVVAVTALTTASYAWFTMQKEVSATGLTLTATAPSNLEIAVAKTVDTDNTPGDFSGKATLAATIKPFMPVSGIYSGTKPTLYYTTKNTTDGAIATVDPTTTFADVTDMKDNARQYYLDIPVWIRTPELDAGTNIELYLKSIDLGNTAIKDAYKVEILNDSKADVKGIFSTSATAWKPIKKDVSTYSVDTTAVTLGTIGTAGTKLGILTAAKTPVKLNLRIWLEGQDAACVVANVKNSVSISLVFEGVDKIV